MFPLGSGDINELIPRIKKTLNILLPTIFPTAMSEFFFNAATTLVANSGSEVPMATIVKPITALHT